MSLFYVQDSDRPAYVVADDYQEALKKWVAMIAFDNGDNEEDVDQPSGISMICDDDELIVRDGWRSENKEGVAYKPKRHKSSKTPLGEKLEVIRQCIQCGQREDAQEHIFDLLRGLQCLHTPPQDITPKGLELKRLWDLDNEAITD